MNNGRIIVAVDELNQAAYLSNVYNPPQHEDSFVMKHFPFAIPDSPQSKYYVQLVESFPSNSCMYGTYWKYGGNVFNSFPSHWYYNSSSFTVGNYIKFKYNMIHADNHSDEDYWYSNEQCQVDTGATYPCEEIYFTKNTEIPLRMTQVVRRGWDVVQEIIPYHVISMGIPDRKLFEKIPKDWSYRCRDVMLGLLFYPQSLKIAIGESKSVQIWLITPPHRIDGNDTVTIEWKPSNGSICPDCFKWTPERLQFNSDDFQQRQLLTITRIKNGPKQTLVPIFNGGGFDTVPPEIFPIFIE